MRLSGANHRFPQRVSAAEVQQKGPQQVVDRLVFAQPLQRPGILRQFAPVLREERQQHLPVLVHRAGFRVLHPQVRIRRPRRENKLAPMGGYPGGYPDGVKGPFTLKVIATGPEPMSFTDHPIVSGVTLIKAIHFTELRSRIDVLRAGTGLAAYGWTDSVVTAGATPVRLVHLLELRTALEAVYASARLPVPPWTDTVTAAAETPIKAVHLMELRAAVVALE